MTVGRPRKEPTKIITVPVNRLPALEKLLGRKLAVAQVPNVKIRVSEAEIDQIKAATDCQKL